MNRALQARHQILLDDVVRMRAYEAAIRAVVRSGTVVVDIGCGLGALSFLALAAGAARVHAIEIEPQTLRLARAAAARRGYSERIHFYQGLAQQLKLPERADVIVTETLGSLGLNENLLPLLIAARRWLAPKGKMMPQRLSITLAPTNYRPRGRDAGLGAVAIPAAALLAAPVTSPTLDFRTIDDPTWTMQASFAVLRTGLLTGFAGWFEVWLTDRIHFTTAPAAPDTHWHQAFLPLRAPLRVHAGQVIDFTIGIAPDPAQLESMIEFDFQVY